MKALTKILAGGVLAAGLVSAAPAAAQYYPGYNYGYGYPGYGYGGNVVGQVINQVLGNGYNGYGYGYRGGSQVAASQCSAAVQQRLGGYAGYGYSPYGGYGGGRVLGINSVEIRSGGGYKVKGVAASGGGYGYGGGNLEFTCRTDYRGFVTRLDFDRNVYGYPAPYADPYSQYGYRRY